ncbi:hypothetical protein EW146_g5056 [Bondarzewia mesenterica]|uniref:DNA mismatch repair protein PMS1 n=1 Tax=Bondarzewia mesenterica TaxID=1095465 RepID=A0A4V3XEZ0_9AGAM|nr:hypothetical protein EW146_g5056 [Bondarzewia mesenterica]
MSEDATKPETSIRAIDSYSVHRITSGQVVIDLQTAVKELVENSLDARASSIEVRFKDYGLKSIEVIDNGSGIAPEDYGSVALKHHTSKLATFEDLTSVISFGFRGEALSSLCAMSDSVVVTTATSSEAPMGTVLEFDRNGQLTSREGKVARQRGTTVIVNGLFNPLPVRRKECERNVKREFGKALNLLNAYALVPCTKENQGVRLTVSNHPDSGRKTVQLRTDGSTSLRSAVSSLWGPKFLENIVDLDIEFDVETEKSVLRRRGLDNSSPSRNTVRVRGLISKFSLGCGRTGTDRQFFFINGRPCNPIKAQKAFNEVYRTFNINQAPFIVADFILPTDSCDINVSPDKRTILLHSENNLVEALKVSLDNTFSSSRSTFSLQATQGSQKAAARSRGGHRRLDVSVDMDDPTAEQRGTTTTLDLDSETGEMEKSPPLDSPGGACTDDTHLSHLESSANNSLSGPAGDALHDKDWSSPPKLNETSSAGSGDNSVSADRSRVNPGVVSSTSTSLKSDTLPSHDEPHQPLLGTYGTPTGSSSVPVPHHETEHHHHFPRILNADDGNADVERSTAGKGREVQMVLDTNGASWNLNRGVSMEGPPKKKGRWDKAEDIGSRSRGGGGALSLTTGLSARGSLRERLKGFARVGSQVAADDIGDEDEEKEKESDKEMEGDMNDVSVSKDKERETLPNMPEGEELGVIDDSSGLVQMDVDELEGTSVAVTSGNITSPIVVDELQDNDLSHDETSGPSDLVENSSSVVAETVFENSSNQEDHRQTEIERASSLEDEVSFSFDISRVTDAWRGLHDRLSRAQTSRAKLSSASLPTAEQVLQSKAGLNNTDDVGAGDALSRVLHKEDFRTMDVVGQFNRGFIVARRRQRVVDDDTSLTDDLFIIDQHAADEKYNFETLQQTTRIESQRLFRPRELELTAADELLAIENIDILKQNGFEIDIGDDMESRDAQRVKLVAQPVSKSTVFDMKDLEELLDLMRDLPSGTMKKHYGGACFEHQADDDARDRFFVHLFFPFSSSHWWTRLAMFQLWRKFNHHTPTFFAHNQTAIPCWASLESFRADPSFPSPLDTLLLVLLRYYAYLRQVLTSGYMYMLHACVLVGLWCRCCRRDAYKVIIEFFSSDVPRLGSGLHTPDIEAGAHLLECRRRDQAFASSKLVALPLELTEKIIKDVDSVSDLLTIRLVNRHVCHVVTQHVFRKLWITNTMKSVRAFEGLAQSKLILTFVEEVVFQESTADGEGNLLPGQVEDNAFDEIQEAAIDGAISNAFLRLWDMPALRTLTLVFGGLDDERRSDRVIYCDIHPASRQSRILRAVANPSHPRLPLTALKIHNLFPCHDEVRDAVPFNAMFPSLTHLRITVSLDRALVFPDDVNLFWMDTIRTRFLKAPTATLTTLLLHSDVAFGVFETFTFEDLKFPRLSSLSLGNATFDHLGGLERFIVEHRATLTRLELKTCTIVYINNGVISERRWSHVWNCFAEQLLLLTDLAVEERVDESPRPGYFLRYCVYQRVSGLKAFVAIVAVEEEDTAALEAMQLLVASRKSGRSIGICVSPFITLESGAHAHISSLISDSDLA